MNRQSDPRLAHRVLQGVVASVLAVGLLLGSVSVFVNGLFALAVTALPTILRREFGVYLSPWATLWIAGAVALHALGMIALYDRIWWWDHVTHLVSAALVAGVGYAVVRLLSDHSEAIHVPEPFLAVFILIFTVALGVAWELAEMLARDAARAVGIEPVLVVYGLEDTMMDLLFDVAGAVVVAFAGGGGVSRLVVYPGAWRRGEK